MTSSEGDPIRILLLGSDVLACAGFKLLLETRPGLQVVAQAREEKEAISLAEKVQPDIVLLREGVEGILGLDIIPALMAVLRQPRIILVTARDPQFYVQAVRKGAVGVVTADQAPQVLFKAIEKVHAGEVWLDRTLIARVLVQKAPGHAAAGYDADARRIAQLSRREQEVIALVGEGLKNQQIAEKLSLSDVTIRHHLTSIFKKLGVADRLELVIFAYQNGLARLPE